MSRTIDERVVSMRFDNQQFESNVQTSISTLDKLKSALKLDGMSRGFENIESNVKRLDFSTLGEAVGTVSSRFSALEIVAITALANITNSAINAGKQIVNSLTIAPISQGFQEYELKMGAVQTIMASTGADVKTVNRYLDNLNEYADRTIYSFSDMTQNIGKFTNAGVSLDSSVKAIKGVSNVAAVAGANTNEASRAMYNFAQALSGGSVKLIDWKSIQNANMATVEFKEQLLDTAVAMGTVVKEGEMYISTTTNAQGKTSDAFNSTKMFNESLQSNWMTTEVLIQTLENYSQDIRTMTDAEKKAYEEKLRGVGYTEQQIKAIEELGIKAADSAKDIKTFSQMMDTLKEAAGSGWAKTFELIFGDFNEAKSLWTSLGSEIEKVLNIMSDSRNNLLETFNRLGGREIAIDGIAAGWKNFKTILNEVKNAYRNIFPKKNIVEQASGLKDIVREFSRILRTAKPTEQTLANLRNTFTGIFSVVKVGTQVLSGLVRVFGALVSGALKISGSLLGISGDIGLAVSNFMEMVSASGAIEKSFDRIVNVIDVFADGISKVIDIVRETISAFSKGGGLASVLDGFARVLETTVVTIVRAFSAITGINVSDSVYGKISEFFKDLQTSLRDIIGAGIDDKLRKIGSAIKDFFSSIKESLGGKMSFNLSEFTDGFKEIKLDPIKKAGDVIKFFVTGLAEVLKASAPLVISLLGAVKNAVVDIVGKIGESITAGNGLGIANILIGGGVGAALLGFAEALHKLSEIFDGIGDMFDVAFIKNLAISLAILAGSLLIISLIDADKLSSSAAAIGVLFAELVAALTAYKKLSGVDVGNKKKGIGGIASSLSEMSQMAFNLGSIIAMSTGVLILAGALKVISTIDTDKLADSVTAITFLIGELTLATTYLSNKKGDAAIGAAGMIGMAAAIVILSAAVKKLGDLKPEQLAKGIGSVTLLLIDMYAMAKALSDTGGLSVSTGLAFIGIAAGLVVLAEAVQTLGNLNPGQLVSGLVGISTVLAGVAIAVRKMPDGKTMAGIGFGMIEMAAAMVIFAQSVKMLGSMTSQEFMTGMLGFAGVLATLVVALRNMPKASEVEGLAKGMLVLSAAMVVLAQALKIIGSLQPEQLVVSLVGLGGALLILVKAMDAMPNEATMMKLSQSMLLLSTALLVLSAALRVMGGMSAGDVATALIALAGAFIIIGVAANSLKGLETTLLAVAGAMTLFGVGVLALSIGLTGLAATTVAAATAIVAALEILIVGILKTIAHSAEALKDAFVALIKAGLSAFTETISDAVDVLLKFIDEVLSSLAEHTPSIVDSLMTLIIGVINAISTRVPELVAAAMTLIGSIFDGIIQGLGSVNVKNLVGGIVAIGLTTALIAAIAAIVPMIPAAMVGILGVGVVIAELALVLAAIGKLNQIPGLEEMAASGGQLLATVGNAIGKFVGSIIGGVGEGLTGSLPTIADNLSDFAKRIIPFTVGMSNVDEGIVGATATLAKAILTLSGAAFIDGIMSFLGISTNMDEFGEKLVAFGRAVKQYGDEVADLDASLISASAIAGKALVELASNIPNTGGLVSFITGENDMGKFGEQLVKFGEAMSKYNSAISGVDPSVIQASANAGSALVDMAGKIPNTGGLVSFITGDNDMGEFGNQLVKFGEGMSRYNDAVKGVNASVIQQSVTAGQALLELAATVPNTGGLVSFITGDNDMGVFGDQLVKFGEAMSEYCAAVKGVTADAVTASVEAGKMVVELANTIPTSGGLFSFFTGSNDMGKFGEQLVKFGTALKQYCAEVSGISAEQVGGVVDGLMRMIEFANAATGIDVSGMSGFGQAMATMARNGITEFVNTFSNSTDEAAAAANSLISAVNVEMSKQSGVLQTAGTQASQALITAMSSTLTSETGKVTSAATNVCVAVINAVRTGLPASTFNSIAQTNIMQALINGINAKRGLILSTVTNVSNSVVDEFRKKLNSSELNKIGQAAVQKIIDGINAKKSVAVNTATTVSTAIVDAFRKKLSDNDNNKIGQEIVEKIIDGIKSKKSDATNAAKDVADAIIDTFSNSLDTSDLNAAGQAAVQNIIDGMNSKSSSAAETASGISKGVVDAFSSGLSNSTFVAIGENAGAGLETGITNKTNSIANAAIRAAKSAVDSAKRVLQERSPSKVFIRIGEYASLGLANGLLNLVDTVGSAGETVGKKATDAVQDAMVKAINLLEDDSSLTPTIRPVLDLSEIQNGANSIDSLLSGIDVSPAYARTTSIGNVGRFDSVGENGIFGDGSATIVNNFTQNNYSPHALSRKDIYRETRNLFSAQKGAVAAV